MLNVYDDRINVLAVAFAEATTIGRCPPLSNSSNRIRCREPV
jgi:hypothetical protein